MSPEPRRPLVLAVDAGGSGTRAVVVTRDGTCTGYAVGPAGNPTSAGPSAALAAVTATSAAALAQAGATADDVHRGVLCMAGAQGLMPLDQLAAGLGAPAAAGRLRLAPDILAMFRSGGPEAHGAAVVAGTGSVAARVHDGRVVRTVGGTGWLLGDSGSGFALGHAVVRAVVDALDGTGEPTALTPLLLAQAGLTADTLAGLGPHGRPRVLERMVDTFYTDRPVALARFAPLAGLAGDDPVALGIVRRAQDDLSRLIDAVRDADATGPLVLGGSVLHHMLGASGRPVAGRLAASLEGAEVRTARDGVVGAAAVALAEVSADDGALPAEVHARVARTVQARREATAAPVGPGGPT